MDSMLKYVSLANWLRSRIEDGRLRPGEKISSENELCRIFGLSRQTVRQAIGLLEQEGLVSRRKGSGTYVTPGGGRPKAEGRNIGVAMTYLDSYIFPAIIKGIERVLSQHGFGMLLAVTRNQPYSEARVLRSFWDNRVAGLLAEPTKSGLPSLNLDLYREFDAAGLPIVFMNASYPQLDLPCISLDDRAAGLLATRHLLSRGHRRIAGIFKADDLQGHLRYQGYMEALAEAGLEGEPGQVLWYATEDIPFFEQDMGRVLRYLSGCTGLVCYNDAVAYPLCQRLRQRGIGVPEQLSVVSVDNVDPTAAGNISLTSIAHPLAALGEAAARALMRRMQEPGAAVSHIFEPRLVQRSSVKQL